MSDDTIRIVTHSAATAPTEESNEASDGKKGGIATDAGVFYFPDAKADPEATNNQPEFRFNEVSARKIEEELARYMRLMDGAIQRAEQQANLQATELEGVEVSLAVGANGSLSILGMGAGLAGSTSITLKFKRK